MDQFLGNPANDFIVYSADAGIHVYSAKKGKPKKQNNERCICSPQRQLVLNGANLLSFTTEKKPFGVKVCSC
jgi:hypothetical protein